MPRAVMDDAPAIEMTGRLEREAGGFVLTGDDGVHYRLELDRTPVDLIAKRARIVGRQSGIGVVTVDQIGPA